MLREFSLVLMLCLTGVDLSQAFERPVITIRYPLGLMEDGVTEKFSSMASLTVLGDIAPPVGDRIRVQIFQVQEDGKLRRMTGVTSLIREGKFQLVIDPPGGGWTAGQVRVVTELEDLPQVKASVDVTVAPVELGVREPLPPPADSGIALDLAKCRGTVARVPANQHFYVQGTFDCEGVESKFEGPKVVGMLSKEPVDGKGKAHWWTGISLSLREAEGKPRFGYEVQLRSPPKPGVFGVRITPHVGMWTTELDREKPDFFIEVTEPKK